MKNKFFVYLMEPGRKNPIPYDILPYFSYVWGKLKPKSKEEALKDLSGWIERELKYQFWARCEYEMLVSHWPPGPSEDPVKVDVYQQALPNLSIIIRLFRENEGIA